MLPVGTSLRYERGFERFDAFTIDVNVCQPLSTAPPPVPFLRDPIEGTEPPLTDEGLVALLRSLGVRRTDLERIEARIE